jgi:predicted NBD/HSP70 family sugar kinase
MPGWDGYPVRDRFVERFAAPAWVDNDVNVMALGERRAGAARDHETAVFVKVGTGIGAGLIVDGALLRGAKGCAGDIGHIQVGESTVCWCGNVGCLEALAGGAALARDGQTAARDGRSAALAALLDDHAVLEAADISAAALAGDAASMELILNSGRLIGRVVATIVNVINPSLVVIGGGVAGAGDGFLAAIRETVYGRSTPLATRDLLVTRSALHGSGGVVGAAAMVVDELFSRTTLPAWLDHGEPAVLVASAPFAA